MSTGPAFALQPDQKPGWSLVWMALTSLGLAGVVLVSLVSAPRELMGLGICLVAAPAFILFVQEPSSVFLGWLIATASFNVLLSQASVDVGFKVYALDGVFLAGALAAGLERPTQDDLTPVLSRRAVLMVCGLLIFGAAEAGRGALGGNVLSDVLGTFRRMFFYPVVAYVLVTVFLRDPGGIRRVAKALWASSGIIAIVFLLRVVTGTGYRSEIFESDHDVIRYLSYAEALTLTATACLALALWAVSPPQRLRWKWLAASGILSTL